MVAAGTATGSQQNDQTIVAKAMLKATERLGLAQADLSKIVGVSQPTLTRLKEGESHYLHKERKEFELALMFIRLYRSLDAIMGGDDAVSAKWLKSHNTAINAVPLERIKSIEGLVDVLSYLDSRRALI